MSIWLLVALIVLPPTIIAGFVLWMGRGDDD